MAVKHCVGMKLIKYMEKIELLFLAKSNYRVPTFFFYLHTLMILINLMNCRNSDNKVEENEHSDR